MMKIAAKISSAPNHLWGIDITSIGLRAGWMYLVAILDWYSRYVVCWQLDQTMHLPFILEAMQQALEYGAPQICNSDQDSQFSSPQNIQLLTTHRVRISMVSCGKALDTIFAERLWRTITYEETCFNTSVCMLGKTCL